MNRYLELVPKEGINYNGATASIDTDNAVIYKPLRRIAHPANNGHGDWTETVVITYMDGTTERVRGHVLTSGHIDELEEHER